MVQVGAPLVCLNALLIGSCCFLFFCLCRKKAEDETPIIRGRRFRYGTL